jgi:hypothetical protein
MVRFGFTRARQDMAARIPGKAATAPESLTGRGSAAPTPGEITIEIGLVLALHLAFAVAVLLTLNVLGVN